MEDGPANVIETLLPGGAVGVEMFSDAANSTLFPEEEATLERAGEKRRREFTTGRACAHAALERLGHPAVPIIPGSRGEPRWPVGIVGSITHCAGYRACAVAYAFDLPTIGIDAEPNEPLPDGVLADIGSPRERQSLAEIAADHPAIRWDRLLFSLKEAVYKAWFPLTERWLGFDDAEVAIDPHRRSFSARLLVPGPTIGANSLSELSGRWTAHDGLLLAAAAA